MKRSAIMAGFGKLFSLNLTHFFIKPSWPSMLGGRLYYLQRVSSLPGAVPCRVWYIRAQIWKSLRFIKLKAPSRCCRHIIPVFYVPGLPSCGDGGRADDGGNEWVAADPGGPDIHHPDKYIVLIVLITRNCDGWQGSGDRWPENSWRTHRHKSSIPALAWFKESLTVFVCFIQKKSVFLTKKSVFLTECPFVL